ncbi:MAG: double zinc ribbon domain-containing protein [Oscillospiraceae bacterium]|jgi:ComF family protein|nr:double zinc ribbon domain-containing protein [Oscillospiraceae bacterium]
MRLDDINKNHAVRKMQSVKLGAVRFWEHALHWIFPRRCVLCGGVTASDEMVCQNCGADAETLRRPLMCLHCRLTLENCTCESDRRIKLVSVFPYQSDAKNAFNGLKFNGDRAWAHSIGQTMADALCETLGWDDRARRSVIHTPPLFCAVPMTRKQEKTRGYNQSILIAKAAARWVGDPFCADLLRKTAETRTQHKLRACERDANVAGAYAVAARPIPRTTTIVLCDDVVTTGATMRTCAAALQQAGYTDIVCLSFLETKLEEKA